MTTTKVHIEQTWAQGATVDDLISWVRESLIVSIAGDTQVRAVTFGGALVKLTATDET